jgi:hypothetical protein
MYVMKYLLPVIPVIGLLTVSFGCGKSTSTTDTSSVSLPDVTFAESTTNGTWLVNYCLDGEKLSYAVISGPQEPVHGHSGVGGDSTGKLWAYLDKPDGSKIPILGTGRIFFVSGTNVTECPQHISGKTFEAFVDSKPSDYSMQALLTFGAGHK